MAPKAKITQVPATQPSLDSWISIGAPRPLASSSGSASSSSAAALPSLAELDAELITYSEPLIEKDSIFLAVTFALHGPPSVSKLQTLFNKYLSPPRHSSLPAVFQKDKGINPSHRMYAWRALGLRDGRNGKAGPDDYEIKEGSDDDDERWGGDRILKVLRDRGGIDVLVVCCRWFGGTLIGPIRFQLIEDTTKASLKAHQALADVQPHKIELLARDARILSLRTKLDPFHSPEKKAMYEDLTLEKAERLVFARGKTIEGLERKVREMASGGGGVEGARSDLKRRVEQALGEDDGEVQVVDGNQKAPLPSFAKKAKVVTQEESSAREGASEPSRAADAVVPAEEEDETPLNASEDATQGESGVPESVGEVPSAVPEGSESRTRQDKAPTEPVTAEAEGAPEPSSSRAEEADAVDR